MTGAVLPRRVATRRAGSEQELESAPIAAICVSREARLAARNTGDFDATLTSLLNPWGSTAGMSKCRTYSCSVTLAAVPTARPRHVITESDVVARALDDAAHRWPNDSANRAKLLLHLVNEGHKALIGEQKGNAAARRRAVAATSGALTGLYGENYLDALREDWPT